MILLNNENPEEYTNQIPEKYGSIHFVDSDGKLIKPASATEKFLD